MSVPSFTSALTAAQNKEKFSEKVQSLAGSVNADAFAAAVEAVLAGGDDATVSGDQAAALKAGFEFATELVKELSRDPGNEDKLKLYAFFKRAKNVTPEQPGMFQLEAKYKYNAWKEISHVSEYRAQALYVQKVNALIDSVGFRQ
ncbi:acyl CoA binding protein-domain-containing protein [Aspergillus egyptiacus]|nr:acyl CoA binding protein-domain-containing protein [Aspergillus egyptiacus]